MNDFVLYSSLETPHAICQSEFEKYTKNAFPFKQNYDGKNHYYATCPECENPIQIRGLYSSDRKYGAHTGKNIDGLNEFNYENYIYCPRAVKGMHVPKEIRKEEMSQKDIAVYNTVRNNFDLAVAFAKKHLGYFISDSKAEECLQTYFVSQGWMYPHSTVNNVPFMLFYLQPAMNPYGLWIKKNSELEQSIQKVKELKLEKVSGKASEIYSKLMVNGKKYLQLTMMLWNHQFKEDEKGSLKESINIQICKNISQNSETNEWEILMDKKIQIPELEFMRFINSEKAIRNEELQNFAYELMPPLQLDNEN